MIGEDDEESFQEFMLRLMTPLYKKLGFEEGENDDHLTLVLRRFVKGFTVIYKKREGGGERKRGRER